ncbi:HD domain-containing phosphohydrolase [Bdellovibrionota bacterium FG-2]
MTEKTDTKEAPKKPAPASGKNLDVQLLSIGLSYTATESLQNFFDRVSVQSIPLDLETLVEPVTPLPHIVLCSVNDKKISFIEVAQTLGMNYGEFPIFLICESREGYDRKVFIKNGFTDAFLLPLELTLLIERLEDIFAKLSNGALKVFKPVKLVDLQPGAALDFDTSIFLPANKKYIRMSAAGDEIDSERMDRMKKHQVSSVYVSSEDMTKFYQYTAKRLKELNSSSTISVTEKRERLQTAVRELLSGIYVDTTKELSFEQGQGLTKDCQEIVKTYIMSSEEANWYSRFQNLLGEKRNAYTHASNVSAFSALFSMGLGLGKPEDLAMAGILMDIGLADVPAEIQSKPADLRTPEEEAIYRKHPEMAMGILKHRKIIVNDKVQKAILQHHETFDGSGYPKGYAGERVCVEAQILSLAEHFDQMTTPVQGQKLLSPAEAIKKMRANMESGETKMIFNPKLLAKILDLFPA